jgi:type II secretory pathway component PulF
MELKDIERNVNIYLFKSDTNGRVKLWRKLSKLLSDGIPIITSLDELRNVRLKKDATYFALKEWAAVMKNGKRFSDATLDWVTSEEAMLLMAGDQAGALAISMQSVIKVTKAKQSIKSAVLNGIAYPAFLFILAFAVMFMFSNKIIPAFAKAARSDNWVGIARTMIDVSGFVQHWFVWMVLGVIILIAALLISMPLWSGPTRTIFDRYPPYSIYRIQQGASWLIAMSALIQAGVRIESAMEQLMAKSSNWAKVRIFAALRGMKSGKNLGAALVQTKYEFPDREIISDIQIYANKSGFDEALRIIGDEWITESVDRIQEMMGKVFAVALIFAGGVIAFMVAGMFAMQMQLSQLMQHAGR